MKYIPKYQLNIRLPDGSVRPLAVRGSYTIARILSEAGVKGRLHFKGKTLPVDAILESLGIGAGSSLEIKMEQYAEYDANCPLCRKDHIQPQPHADSVCWTTYCNSHPDKLIVVLNRHSPQPTPEELSQMKDVAEKILPGQSWRGPVAMPQHFHLHQV